MFHDHETAGHPGELETYNLVKQHYWWSRMWIFVKWYVQGCGICQQFKINRNLSHPSYLPIAGAKSTRHFASCSMDMITDLPTSGGYDSILAVVDHSLMKGVILVPCNKTLMADQCMQLLLDNIYKQFGLMDKIISNRGPQFVAKSFLELLKLLKIKSSLTMAYHPQSDGATERVNQEIEAYISIFCMNNPDEWSTMLSTMEFAHNNWRHADRLNTPFELMLGITPVAIPLAFEHTKYPSIEEKMNNLIKNQEEALAAHKLARTCMAGRCKDTFTPFEKGQKVWLDSRKLKTHYHKKIRPKWEGLFEIEEVLGPVTYWLKLPETWRIHNVFHAVLLRPYTETEAHGNNYPWPLPDLLEGEEVYTVEWILKHRCRGHGYQYYVLWEGYPITEASWESESAFSTNGDTLSNYKEQHQFPWTCGNGNDYLVDNMWT